MPRDTRSSAKEPGHSYKAVIRPLDKFENLVMFGPNSISHAPRNSSSLAAVKQATPMGNTSERQLFNQEVVCNGVDLLSQPGDVESCHTICWIRR